MENIASLWSYQEIIDEVKQKLSYRALELESVRAKANEEMKMHKEYEKQSLQLLKMAILERDEAREQLHLLLNKLRMLPSTIPTTEFHTNVPQLSPKSPLTNPIKAPNSGISESNNSLSEPYHYRSQNSSPVDSFFDAVSSPELSNINNHMGDSNNKMGYLSQPFVQDPSAISSIDECSLIIDNLVKGKTLPEKGNLLQSVLEAGPLIQTLLLAGPLPRWRNPPPLQAFNIPPVSVKGSGLENDSQKPNGNSQSSPMMLNFGNGDSGCCVGNGRLMVSQGASGGGKFVPTGKRQKFL